MNRRFYASLFVRGEFDARGNKVSWNAALFCRPFEFSSRPARLRAKIRKHDDSGDAVTLASQTPALRVWISLNEMNAVYSERIRFKIMFNFDLHIHSCLSPCGDLDNSPKLIGRRAKEVGLDGIMLSDHNSSRNAPAMREVCRREGLRMLYGMELTTAEEAHCLAIFDTQDQADQMMEYVYDCLPAIENDPEIFGAQIVVDADEQVLEMEPMMLSAPTSIRIVDAGKRIHQLGGLFVAAHLDRPYFSVTSQLGSLAGDEGFDAVEISRHADVEAWREKVLGLPILRNSDAHYVDDIGVMYNRADLKEFSVAALKDALRRDGVEHVRGRGKRGM